MNHKDSIERTKQGFEASFKADSYYNRQTKDKKHLEMIMNCLQVKSGMKILDLGTGTGYLAFPFAKKYSVQVVGLDIVENALEENRKRARAESLNNLHFINYDGIKFPFDSNSFDMVITRYALHHFPDISSTFSEINRVLKNKGVFFLSDPTPNDDDTSRFVDEYMQMKKDGHIKFYTKQEWLKTGKLLEFNYVDSFETTIRFPRKRKSSLEFDNIVSHHNQDVIKGYCVEIIDDEIWITEKVNNILFQKA